jgi:hypothetical protein
VAASPELADRLAEQERAVRLARSAALEVEAPQRLRALAPPPRRTSRARRRRRSLLAAGAPALVAVLALLLALFVVDSHPAHERFAATLSPTALAAGARGYATLTMTSAGWRIELDATGLPRISGRRFYEAWLRNSGGVLVPIGTFNEPRKVTLWAGVSPRDFATLTVTREQADGDQSSSGIKVLSGELVRTS